MKVDITYSANDIRSILFADAKAKHQELLAHGGKLMQVEFSGSGDQIVAILTFVDQPPRYEDR